MNFSFHYMIHLLHNFFFLINNQNNSNIAKSDGNLTNSNIPDNFCLNIIIFGFHIIIKIKFFLKLKDIIIF